MSDRYITTDQGWRCYDCGGHVYNRAYHDAFHARIDLMYDAIPVSMIETLGHPITDMRVNRRGVAMVGGLITDEPPLTSITATDWQAAHDAGEDEELRVPDPKMLCAMCGTEVHKRSGSSWRCDNCRMWRDAIPAPQRTLESQPDTPTEPPVGSVARCTGCGNVYVHRPDGWLATDGPVLVDSWSSLARSFCGPVKVIYNPEEDK